MDLYTSGRSLTYAWAKIAIIDARETTLFIIGLWIATSLQLVPRSQKL